MRLKIIARDTFTRELGYLGAGCPNTLDITWLPSGPECPDGFGALLQACIDKTDRLGPAAYDAILLALGADDAYGAASRWFPLVVPRAHDCAALLLGSAERMRQICLDAPADLFWYTPGRLERRAPDGVFGDELERYSLPCGADCARMLLALEQDWAKFGGHAAYVELPGLPYPDFLRRLRACTEYLGWPLSVHQGNASLLLALLNGNWSDHFLTIAPGCTFEPSYHSDIIRLAL